MPSHYKFYDPPGPDQRIHGVAISQDTIAVGSAMLEALLFQWYEPGFGRGDILAMYYDGGSIDPKDRSSD